MKLRRLHVWGFLLLTLNSAYIWSFADPSIFYMGNVVLHMLLGISLMFVALRYLFRCIGSMSAATRAATLLFLLCAIPGMVIMVIGGLRPYRWVLHLHIGLALMAVLAAGLALRGALKQRQDSQNPLGFAWRSYVLSLSALVFLPVVVISYNHFEPDPRDRIHNPMTAPTSMEEEGDGSSSPFYPSSATTTTGKTIPSNFFMTSETCKRCHRDIYKQWYSSMHHFSSFNNQWYRKSIEYMQDVVGVQPSKWCAGCHDHAVFFNGKFDIPIKEQLHSPEAQAGLACTSCHSIVQVRNSIGNGAFVIEYPPLHDLATSNNKLMQWVHDFLIKVAPEPHRKVFLKPFHTKDTPELCSACHKVHLDVPVNRYRWIRGFNDYDNWQASGVSGQGARSFYYPKQPMKCADCHMPLVPSKDMGNINGMVHSHRFPAANTAVPTSQLGEEQLKATTDFLKNKHVTIDIFALGPLRKVESGGGSGKAVRPGEFMQAFSTFAVGEESEAFGIGTAAVLPTEEVIAPIDKVNATVRRGDSVRIDVVVRTRTVGHFFPGGTVDAFDVWIELQAVDDRGQILFWSGKVENEGKGPVEPGAHTYRSYQLDEHGNPINKRNAWAARSVLYVRLIPPGAADTAHFRLEIPETAGNRIFLKAKLNYRKFSWWNTQWAFAGIRDPQQGSFGLDKGYDDGVWVFKGDLSDASAKIKAIPDVPIVTMADDSKELRVVNRKSPIPEMKYTLDKADLLRWNDYGIGLLLQGDLRLAEAVFLKVTEIDPTYVDGWVNVGRSRIQEGNISGAQEVLKKALDLDGNLAKTHYFYALTLKTQGKYDEALSHLRKVLSVYPRDRVVRNQAGRILFLRRQYQDAIGEFQESLRVDPEDLQAHYNLMLCYQGLGNREMAEREKKLYLRFKADESAQFITGPVRLLHPEANNERQPIHEHVSVLLDHGKADSPATQGIKSKAYARFISSQSPQTGR